MNQTAVHSPAVSEEAEAGLGHYSLKEFSKSEEKRGGGVEYGHCEELSRRNDTNTISTVQETIEQLVSTARGDITHDL